MKKIIIALSILYCGSFAYGGVDLRFKLTVVKGFKAHLDLLEYPSYIALALANNNILPETLGRMEIIDPQTLQVNSEHLSKVRFTGRSGDLFHYEAEVQPIPSITLKVPVDINATNLDEGIVHLTLHPRMANWIPQILIDKINLKINKLLNIDLQNSMVAYLGKCEKVEPSSDKVKGKVEQILLDAYKGSSTKKLDSLGWQPGDAEPLSKQWKLLGSLLFLFVTLPMIVVLWFWRLHNSSM